jgi:hypothetical protein
MNTGEHVILPMLKSTVTRWTMTKKGTEQLTAIQSENMVLDKEIILSPAGLNSTKQLYHSNIL